MARVSGRALVLSKNLNFYGGLDLTTGEITDVHHPERGSNIAGTVLVMPGGEGSSSSPTALIECMRAGNAPAAILTPAADLVISIAAYIARLLDQTTLAHFVVPDALRTLHTGDLVTVSEVGGLEVEPAESAAHGG
jgi:predicted aconitase with swiveling domain